MRARAPGQVDKITGQMCPSRNTAIFKSMYGAAKPKSRASASGERDFGRLNKEADKDNDGNQDQS